MKRRRSWSSYPTKKRRMNSYSFSKKAVAQIKRGFTEGAIRVKHAEHVRDMLSATDLTIVPYAINPGSYYPFKWLSRIASKYSEWKFHKCEFFFRSTMADQTTGSTGALGSIIMSWQSNVYDQTPTTKIELENTHHSKSGKPSENLRLAIPSAGNVLRRQFVEDGIAIKEKADIRLDYNGEFQFSVTGMPNVAQFVIGELWVKYDVELMKPKERDEMLLTDNYLFQTGIDDADPLGTDGTVFGIGIRNSTLGTFEQNTHTIRFKREIESGIFLIVYEILFGAAGNATFAGGGLTNCEFIPLFESSLAQLEVPGGASTGLRYCRMMCIRITGPSAMIDLGAYTFTQAVQRGTVTITQLFDSINQ